MASAPAEAPASREASGSGSSNGGALRLLSEIRGFAVPAECISVVPDEVLDLDVGASSAASAGGNAEPAGGDGSANKGGVHVEYAVLALGEGGVELRQVAKRYTQFAAFHALLLRAAKALPEGVTLPELPPKSYSIFGGAAPTDAAFLTRRAGLLEAYLNALLPLAEEAEVVEFALMALLRSDEERSSAKGEGGRRREGYLSKQGRIVKSWKQRWFSLRGDTLSYYKAPGDREPQGEAIADVSEGSAAPLGEARCRELGRGPWCFGLYLPGRALLLEAQSEGDMLGWLGALRNEAERSGVGQADFELISVLGRGHFAKVMLVRKRDTGRMYALKVLRKALVKERNQVEHTKAERDILARADHPFVVGLHYAFQSATKLYLVLDYCPGGELFGHLQRVRRMSEDHARLYLAEIVLALEHLHSMGVVYRDLKPENILIDAGGHLRLADFGLSKRAIFGDDNNSSGQPAGGVSASGSGLTYTFCGTPEYMSPEVVLEQGHGAAVDMWATGVLACEMMTGQHPFYSKHKEEMYRRILTHEPQYPSYLSADARDLMNRLTAKAPAQRLGGGLAGIAEVKAHPFFGGIDWDAVLARSLPMPYVPSRSSELDVAHFDAAFTREVAVDSVVGDGGRASGGGVKGTALMAAADARSVAGANKLAINPNTAAGSSDAGGAASKRADSVFGNFSYSKETDGADPAARAAGLAAELDRSASMK